MNTLSYINYSFTIHFVTVHNFFCSLASAVVCGAPFFDSRVFVEPFCSTTVGSEIYYQCQTGVLPEERITLLCGEDGRWNSDPQALCTGKDLLSLPSCYYASVCLPGFYFCSREQFIHINCHSYYSCYLPISGIIAETTVHEYVVIAYIYYIM